MGGIWSVRRGLVQLGWGLQWQHPATGCDGDSSGEGTAFWIQLSMSLHPGLLL